MQPFDGNDSKQSNRDTAHSGVVDDNLVYYANDKQGGSKKKKPVAVIFIVVLTVIAAAVALFIVFMPRGGVPATAPATTAASFTEAAQETTQAATQETIQEESTSAAATAASPDADEDKLMAFARETGLLEILYTEADSKMTVTVTAEQNILVARYLVEGDSQDDEEKEYFEKLSAYFDAVSARLDKPVYEMKRNSGVNNALLQLEAVDKNGVHLYSNIID